MGIKAIYLSRSSVLLLASCLPKALSELSLSFFSFVSQAGYQKCEFLGAGAYGKVYKVKKTTGDDQVYVLKQVCE